MKGRYHLWNSIEVKLEITLFNYLFIYKLKYWYF